MPRLSWSYISGFFDGEGGITVASRAGSKVLSLKITIAQRSLEILTRIKAFLMMVGIHSVIYPSEKRANILEVRRANDLAVFLQRLKSIVKRKQVESALDYLEGKISGNQLLEVYEGEFKQHKRKRNPKAKLGLRFPLTRLEAVEDAAIKSAVARINGSRRSFLERVQRRVKVLPPIFGVKEIVETLGVTKKRAQVIGRTLENLGLVKSHFERVPPRFRKKVFERVE